MRSLKIICGCVAVVTVILAWSFVAEWPKYHFEKLAKLVGQQLPGARLIQQVKSGDLSSPVSWFWPATTTFNYAMPDLAEGRFYLVSLRYDEKDPSVYLIDTDCEARDVSLYDLDEPESAYPARDFLGDPVKAPNGKTFRLFNSHFAPPPEWLRALCDTDWTTERKAVFKARQAQ
jgi:hypothetical protein